ncbi:O-antigen ligase [Sphingomonas sp.]|uniref:O-antigen ligase family protein n=1 Tax=Sphingomonas sp. TaxID=28214 RepID=UPI0025DA8F97|nr:O-antigen ligase family protein [Sphingomonas sp.]
MMADMFTAKRSGRSGLPRRQFLLATLVALISLTLLGPAMTVVDSAGVTGEGSPIRQIGYIVIALMALYAIRPLDSLDRVLCVPIGIVITLAWCWLSLGWAIDPAISLRRVLLTTIIIWTIFAVVRQLGYQQVMLVLRIAFVIALLVNFLTVLMFPQIGIHQANEPYDKALIGDWRGFMLQKNLVGSVCAITIIVFTFDAKRIPKALRAVVIALAAFFLFKTESKTSLALCAFAIGLAAVFQFYSARYRVFVLSTIFLLAIVVAVLVGVYNDPLLQHLNDPTALTGRTRIWSALASYASDHPWTGSGYGSFWNIGAASPIYQYSNGWVLTVTQGHNGYLDVVSQTGVPGLLLVVGAVIVYPLVRLLASPLAQGPRGALILGVFMFCIAHNVTESSIFDRDTLVEVFLMMTIALLWTITRATPRRGQGDNRLFGNTATRAR